MFYPEILLIFCRHEVQINCGVGHDTIYRSETTTSSDVCTDSNSGGNGNKYQRTETWKAHGVSGPEDVVLKSALRASDGQHG